MTGWQKITVVALCFGALIVAQAIVPDPNGRVAISSLVSLIAGWMMRSPGDAASGSVARIPTLPETPDSKGKP